MSGVLSESPGVSRPGGAAAAPPHDGHGHGDGQGNGDAGD